MEKYILAFYKEIIRFIKFVFVDIPTKLGLLACILYIGVGTLINILLCIDKPFLKMGMIGAQLRKEDEG